MKVCAGCGKVLDDDAKFCSACGAPLDGGPEKKQKWYYNQSSLVISFLVVGPFMLPLVWSHPKLSNVKKAAYTIIILVLTYVFYQVFLKSMSTVFDAYKMVGSF
jgi:uncharacterized membrane protein YvbJ